MAILKADGVVFEMEVPIVIVGAGACGLVAALAASEGGAAALVLERDKAPSGSTSLSQGLVPAVGTRLQRERGIDDSVERFVDDIVRKTRGETDPEIAALIARESGPAVDWLTDAHGLDLHLVEDFLYPGHSAHRMHGPPNQSGQELEAALLAAAEKAGVDILTEATVTDLYVHADGTVAGVGIDRPGGASETLGCEALILACNGFGGNPQMLSRYIPEITRIQYTGHRGNQGDAVLWGEALGARLADMGAYQGHGAVAEPQGVLLTWATVTEGGFQVNRDGRRFGNEALGYSEFAAEVEQQPGRFAWSIYDARCETPALSFQEYRDLVAVGAVRSADSLDALAQVTGVSRSALHATFDEVTKMQAGLLPDPFGRDFTVKPMLAPPYRAMKTAGALFHTQGGLVVDSEARVVRMDGGTLPNLFAGGGAARGISGPSSWGYLAGNGLVTAIVFGRLAGATAARQIAR